MVALPQAQPETSRVTNSFPAALLPADAVEAILIGRLLLDEGPTPIVIREGAVFDVSRRAPTVADLIDLGREAAASGGTRLCAADSLPAARLLSPLDLQVVKAAGVTFAISAIERVIEERARGDS